VVVEVLPINTLVTNGTVGEYKMLSDNLLDSVVYTQESQMECMSVQRQKENE
jgi:hypothetical protein